MAKPDEIFERIAATARDSGRRSKLYRWMRRNHDDFAMLIEEHRPSWHALAEQFAKEWLTGPNGQPLKAATARRLWYSVRQDHVEAQGKAKRGAGTEGVAVEKPVAPAGSKAPADAATPGADNDPLARIRQQAAQMSGKGKP